MDGKLGFIGSGNIVRAIARGLVKSNFTLSSNVCMSSPVSSELNWANNEGYVTTSDNLAVLKFSKFVILAVKPHIVRAVLDEINPHLTCEHVLISVAAGITLDTIQNSTTHCKLARIMLNTTVETCNGVCVYAVGRNCVPNIDDVALGKMLENLGYCKKVPEYQFDVCSALIGSGPSFLYGVIEALTEGAVYCGLPAQDALEMATHTMFGTGFLAKDSLGKLHPAQLRANVCSPGGSSIRGVKVLEDGKCRSIFMNAVIEAYERNKELGKQ